jgi:transcriptional regulator with XRE-family HTH domain
MSITPEAPAKTLTEMVATRIRIAMAVEDIRQAELSRRMGKNEQWLSVRLRGRQPIDTNDLVLFAKALSIGVHDLLPAPEEAASAAIPRYSQVADPPDQHTPRPRDNRPPGHPRGLATTGVVRTARLPRTQRRPGR